MTKEEYLQELKNNLRSLTEDEVSEAIQYYSDFIDESEDSEKAMESLGTPDAVAAKIKEKLSNAIVSQDNKLKEGDKEQESSNEQYSNDSSLFFKYPKNQVTSLSINIGAAEVVFIQGEDYSIETRGLDKNDLHVKLKANGSLEISNSKKINYRLWNHDRQSTIFPRFLIAIPENAYLEKCNFSLGCGYIRSKEIKLFCNKGNIEIGAGNLVLSEINGSNINFRCGMGNLECSGSIKGRINVDCGMGNISLNLKGKPEDFSYDAKVFLGEFDFNHNKHKGICKEYNQAKKSNHISTNCAMGKVSINMENKE